jgi:hypothetical protein
MRSPGLFKRALHLLFPVASASRPCCCRRRTAPALASPSLHPCPATRVSPSCPALAAAPSCHRCALLPLAKPPLRPTLLASPRCPSPCAPEVLLSVRPDLQHHRCRAPRGRHHPPPTRLGLVLLPTTRLASPLPFLLLRSCSTAATRAPPCPASPTRSCAPSVGPVLPHCLCAVRCRHQCRRPCAPLPRP